MRTREGIQVGRCRIRGLMKKLGLGAVGPKPNTSKAHPQHKRYRDLLRGLLINRPNPVWATDITYAPKEVPLGDIRMRQGFLYLCAILDWATRRVLNWRWSNTLTTDLCTAARKEALARYGRPELFNRDQGSQFTSAEFTGVLAEHEIQISREGRGRCHDNLFVERLWWVKHEWVYLRPCDNGMDQQRRLAECLDWYNRRRPHQSHGWRTPDEVYFGQQGSIEVNAA
jgi:putative transposase